MEMIRGTDIDSWMIGLYVWKDGGNYCDSGESAILSAGFDGNSLTPSNLLKPSDIASTEEV
jgi:hypothetical protein